MISIQELNSLEKLEKDVVHLAVAYKQKEKELYFLRKECNHDNEMVVIIDACNDVNNHYLTCFCLGCGQTFNCHYDFDTIAKLYQNRVNAIPALTKLRYKNYIKILVIRRLYKLLLAENPNVSHEQMLQIMQSHFFLKHDGYSDTVKLILQELGIKG